MDSLSRQYGIDPVRMQHLIKLLMAFVAVRVKEGQSLQQIEDDLLKNAGKVKVLKRKNG